MHHATNFSFEAATIIPNTSDIQAGIWVGAQTGPSHPGFLFPSAPMSQGDGMGKTSNMPRIRPTVSTALSVGLRCGVGLLGLPVQVATRKVVGRLPVRRWLAGRGNVIVLNYPLEGSPGFLDGLVIELRFGFRVKSHQDRVGE